MQLLKTPHERLDGGTELSTHHDTDRVNNASKLVEPTGRIERANQSAIDARKTT